MTARPRCWLGLVIATAACAAPNPAVDAPPATMIDAIDAPPGRALGLNDVTVLVPLPATVDEPVLATIVGVDRPLIEHGTVEWLVNPDIGAKNGLPIAYADFHVVGLRFDLCAREGPGPCAVGADGQLRVVLQPLYPTATGVFAHDVGLHALYPIPAAELPAVIAELRALAALADVPRTARLGVSPALVAAVPGYRERLRELTLRFARRDRITRLTVLGQEATSAAFAWILRGGDLVDGRLLAGGNAVFATEPVADAPRGFATAINGATFGAATRAEQEQALAALIELADPTRHDPSTVQCLGCHVATHLTARRATALGVDPRLGAYASSTFTTLLACGDNSATTQIDAPRADDAAIADAANPDAAAPDAASPDAAAIDAAALDAAALDAAAPDATSVDAAPIDAPAPTTYDLAGGANALRWDSATSTLYLTDNNADSLVRFTDAGGLQTVGTFPAATAGISLGDILKRADGSFVTANFGFGTQGTLFTMSADGTSSAALTGLAANRRRIGLADDGAGNLYVGYFVGGGGGMPTGGVGLVTITGGAATETEIAGGSTSANLKKIVGVVATATELFVADQTVNTIYRVALPGGAVTTVATPPSVDLLMRLPSGDLLTGGTGVHRITTAGVVTTIFTGFEQVRGTAYDPAGQRLFIIEHSATVGVPDKLHIRPFTP